MKTKSILVIALMVLMTLTLIPSLVFAEETNFDNFKKVQNFENGTFEDVKDSDWFCENVKSVYELNLMVGRNDAYFATEDNMTVAEAFTIAARLNSIYYTGRLDFEKTEPWYKAYTDYCKENSIADIANYTPNDYITRAQFAEIFANALPKEALNEINEIINGEIPDVKDGDSFSSAVYALYRAGILTGNDEQGTFAPNSNIRRMEVAAITARMAVPSQRKIVSLRNENRTDSEFNVCFDLNYEGKILKNIIVSDGEEVFEPSKPTRKGYAFTGWYTSRQGGSKFDFEEEITAETTVYAHWKKKISAPVRGTVVKKYTVTFDMQGHGDIPTESINNVASGSLIAIPDEPAETGWIFDGWYKEAECTNAWNFDTDKVKSNVTLYAKWSEAPACLAAGTMITMADGSLKAVENIEMGDDVVTFNHETGEKSHAKVYDYYEYEELHNGGLTLHFSNNNDVTVVTGHGFYSKQDQKYVVITSHNFKDYIGKEFFNLTEMEWETLEGATICEEPLRTFIVVTEKDINCLANNMLATEDGVYLPFINCFDFDDNMKVDSLKKEADIARWKLYTYEEEEYLTEEAFEALNMQYRNIAIGKGIITEELIQMAIEMAMEMDPSNLR